MGVCLIVYNYLMYRIPLREFNQDIGLDPALWGEIGIIKFPDCDVEYVFFIAHFFNEHII